MTTYKAITVNHGAHHNMKREESIPEGATFPSSRGSGRGSGGSGNTNKSSGPREDLMETWCATGPRLCRAPQALCLRVKHVMGMLSSCKARALA